MNTKSEGLDPLIARAIRADRPTLDGWEQCTADNLDDAVLYRIALLARCGCLDRHMEHEEICAIQAAIGSPKPRITISGSHPECAYLIFSDGSFYFQNNAQSEVWADPLDFIAHRLLCGGSVFAEDFPADSDEGKLIRHAAPHLL